MSQLFASGGQSIGVSALASFLPKNTQDWSPLGWTGWIFSQSKGLSRVFSTPQFKSINSLVLSFLYSPTLTSIHDHWKGGKKLGLSETSGSLLGTDSPWTRWRNKLYATVLSVLQGVFCNSGFHNISGMLAGKPSETGPLSLGLRLAGDESLWEGKAPPAPDGLLF